MPTIKPYFCLAFANPKKDLDFISSECATLEEIFMQADPDFTIIDRRFLAYFDGASFVNIYSDLQKKPLTLFHFSGHANDQSLYLEDGSKQKNQLCKFIEINTVKIAFLNACNTAGLVKDILNTTSVRAVIATNRKVKDESAKNIAISFYKAFIGKKQSLREAFNSMFLDYGQFALKPNAIAINRETGFDDDVNTLDTKNDLAWGLYYLDESALDLTIDLLTGDIESDRDLLESKKEDLEIKIEKLTDELIEVEREMKKENTDFVKNIIQEKYEGIVKKLADSDTCMQKVKANINWLSLLQSSEKLRKKIEQKESTLTYAIKLLNYTPQRKLFKPPSTQPFCSFVVLGDENSVSQLLLTKFYEDNTFDTDTRTFPISSSSTVAGNFWEDFSRFLFANEIKSPREIIEKLIIGNYFGKMKNKGKTHQHLLVQYKSSKLDEQTILSIISSFWTEVTDLCKEQSLVLTEVTHKLIFILVDETASPEKEKLLNEKIKELVNTQDIPFIVLPFIKPLDKDELFKWSEAQQLEKWGIDEDYTNILYGKTNGQIRKVLREIKTKLELDIQLLENI